MMVALMLIATSFGVGYYMVTVYDIDLFWLSSDVSEWVVDSYLFFREIYPAVAGVVLIALFTYFVIASAVRRYKYYLDSGQDYRRMISLADTIDDLTNPAQIARLSDYPELQDVLRNYGDQISEISEGLESRESEMRSVDLEVEIDSILAGQGMNETLAEGNWWAPIARKVKIWADENAGGTEELRKQSEAARQTAGRASLSCGKIIETAAGASEDILEIVKSAGELNAAAASLGSGGSGTVADAGSPSDAIAAIETAAATLGEKGSAIHDLSEESNGLALNIALMAARGEATEKDLAQLAEKVRSAAERFGKLGRELENLARTVAENSRNARSSSGTAVSDSGCASNMEGCGIKEISATIESRSRALQQKMMALGSDVEEINRSLKFEHGTIVSVSQTARS
jgi:methyl-accepting chemotaxis protein